MTKILKTTLATAFAAACLVGATLAADNKGMSPKPGSKNNDSMMQTDPSTTGSVKCDTSHANVNSGCNKPGMLKQEQKQY